jgi:hypothetical protein
MRSALALALLMLAGCSGSTSGSDEPRPAPILVGSGHGPCAARSGTFSETFAIRSGNCGAIPEQIVSIGQNSTPSGDAGACVRSVTESADNCEVTFSSRCPSDGVERGGTGVLSGLAKWNAEGTYATAVEQVTALGADGHLICTGTYDVTVRRQ